MDIESRVREIVREEIASAGLVAPAADPEMIKLDEAARLCRVSSSVVDELHATRDTNGFPSVQLGPRTIRVDKRRLNIWLANGGVGSREGLFETVSVKE